MNTTEVLEQMMRTQDAPRFNHIALPIAYAKAVAAVSLKISPQELEQLIMIGAAIYHRDDAVLGDETPL